MSSRATSHDYENYDEKETEKKSATNHLLLFRIFLCHLQQVIFDL